MTASNPDVPLLRIPGPAIWVVCGLPGTGKSTLAARLAALTGGRHLNTDLVRDRLHLRGHYQPQDKDRVYTALLDEARAALTAGELTILDGTYYAEAFREPVRRLAAEIHCPLIWIELNAPEDQVRSRVSEQRPHTEADFAVYRSVRERWEPIEEPHLVLDSGGIPVDDLAHEALRWLDGPPQQRPGHEG
jgi:predicted kinase